MPANPQNDFGYREYIAWDAPTRWFHWINVLAVLGLIATGVVILTGGQLGLSPEGKITLKSVHVIFGYVMAVNLLWRFVWAFLTGEPEQYVGHNPLARIGVTVLLLLLFIQMLTGLVLAGTDLYWPPFGRLIADWVVAPGVDPGTLVPGSKDLTDATAYQSMRDFRGPIVETHEISFYLIAIAVVLHLIAVVVTEIHEGGSITSAMFTGRKLLTRRPPDAT